eukprot:1156688-Pelagomonas_calceolata.AAC.4
MEVKGHAAATKDLIDKKEVQLNYPVSVLGQGYTGLCLQPGGLTAQLSCEANQNTIIGKATDTQRKVGSANKSSILSRTGELGRSDVLAWVRALSSKASQVVSWKGMPSRLTQGTPSEGCGQGDEIGQRVWVGPEHTSDDKRYLSCWGLLNRDAILVTPCPAVPNIPPTSPSHRVFCSMRRNEEEAGQLKPGNFMN